MRVAIAILFDFPTVAVIPIPSGPPSGPPFEPGKPQDGFKCATTDRAAALDAPSIFEQVCDAPEAALETEDAVPCVPVIPIRQDTQPDKAAVGQPLSEGSNDDALNQLREQIDDCLGDESDPARRFFLERLRYDSRTYTSPAAVDSLRQELEVYFQSFSNDELLLGLAGLHLSWAKDDTDNDPHGELITQGDAISRKQTLGLIEQAFTQETSPMLRCYLAKLARKCLTDPLSARRDLDEYIREQSNPAWRWRAEVAVTESSEAAFYWRLEVVRRKTTDARWRGYLDKLERLACTAPDWAAAKLEAFAEISDIVENPNPYTDVDKVTYSQEKTVVVQCHCEETDDVRELLPGGPAAYWGGQSHGGSELF